MARAPFGFAPWPVVPTAPDDEATPAGLAPGQMPVDPRRDGSVQPTAAGKGLSSTIGSFIAGGPAPMEPTLAEYQQGAEFQPGQTRRPGVLPITTDAQTGQLMLAMPKWADVLGNATPSAVGSALAPVAKAAGETVLGSGPIRAYHGSPHSFDRFDVTKLGTGEGAQAFGHGLYFAENEAIARSYRDALSSRAYTANGKPITDPIGVSIAQDVVDHGVPFEQYIGNREHNLNNVFAGLGDHPALATMRQELSRARELQGAKLTSGSQGHMYEVAIDANPRSFLDFDRPLAGQDLANLRDVVRPTGQMAGGTGPEAEVIRRLQTDPRWQGGWDEDRAWRHLRDAYPDMDDVGLQRIADGVEGVVRGSRAAPPIDLNLTGGELLRVMDRQNGRAGTAKILHEAGIPGVRYLDASARGTGDGTRNIVTFGDDLVSITRKYGVPGAVGAGGTAAALAPGDAQAAPASLPPSTVPFGPVPMAWTSGNLSDRIVGAESGGNATAKNPRSSATGAGQFIDGTWLDMVRRHRPDLASLPRDQVLALRNDAGLSREMVGHYAAENGAKLRAAGLPDTDGSRYLAHFAGPAGARAVLSADPSTPAAQVLQPGQVAANPFVRSMTAGQLADWAARKVGADAPTMRMPGGSSAPGTFGLSGPTQGRAPFSMAPPAGAAATTNSASTGPDLASLLRTLMGEAAAAPQAQAAPAPAPTPAPFGFAPFAAPAPAPVPFDYEKTLALLQPRRPTR